MIDLLDRGYEKTVKECVVLRLGYHVWKMALSVKIDQIS